MILIIFLFIVSSLPLGMKRISCSWVSDERIDLRLSCPHQFCQVIVCTLVYLLQLHMLLQRIAVLLYFIIQGEVSELRVRLKIFNAYLSRLTLIAGQVLQNLSFHWLSMLKQSTTLEFLWACDLGCFLRQKSQVSVGRSHLL